MMTPSGDKGLGMGDNDDPFQESEPVQPIQPPLPPPPSQEKEQHEQSSYNFQQKAVPSTTAAPSSESSSHPTSLQPPPSLQQRGNDNYESEYGLTPLASFVVESAHIGSGMVRPITFFPIVTTIKTADAPAFTAPDVPLGPHQQGLNVGIGRNKWMSSTPAQMERRYSELVEFRTLLVYQFPTLIVPPLPPKSKIEDIGTYFTKENILVAQQRVISRFLRELAIMPELLHFSSFTPNFFQLPRESFEDWMPSLRSALEDFRKSCTSIDAYSKRKGGLLGSDRVNTITEGSTKAVRKIVKLFNSWVGGEKEKAPEPKPAAPAYIPRTSSNTGEPIDSTKYVTYWNDVTQFLTSYRSALTESMQPYFSHMKHAMETISAIKDVSAALEKYAEVLGTSSVNSDLASATRQAHELTTANATALESQQARNKREVYERLLFEVSYIDAALDAVDHALSLWLHRNEIVGLTDNGPLSIYARDVSDKLRRFYENRFLRNFRHRMVNIFHRTTDSERHYAQLAETSMLNTAFAKTIQNPQYLVYSTEP
ncbi:hypothetical protein TRVL_05020 [Trypanosoma vivax]|uniref:PX domain-containing protein n=1 Tax=Trypanosoma vivax (strain Y486) TaxID=1055687 RepID=G0TYS5_TRYVY|nr:hypothetical protein TRVL_05020 [Trypanosoma vivax]CCC49125.1 conserved hypothetical protein [Trypanosoma vivax Y486]